MKHYMEHYAEYCIYLRKSRADLEAEKRGEGETLKRHRTTLMALAKKMNINITTVYSELVSGERIIERPEVQKMLGEVEDGRWAGVLVMEVERLARGDTADQGIVAEAFKACGTKIITPMKIYDPNNQFDEEYFEFGLFMSRREYKTINRRLQGGRMASVEEGNFIGSTPPYGYKKIKLEDGSPTIEIVPEAAAIIRVLFDLYTQGHMGLPSIAKHFNLMQLPTKTGADWTTATLKKMITCDTYVGKVSWNKRKTKKVVKDGVLKREQYYSPKSEWKVYQGKHESIISEEIFDLAQQILAERYHPPAPKGVITSPLATLVVCEKCGKNMVRHGHYTTYRAPTLYCQNTLCDNVSSPFEIVENRVIEALKLWVENAKNDWESYKPEESEETKADNMELIVKGHEKTLAGLKKQNSNLHDLLEKGVYTIDTYLERSQNLAGRIAETESALVLVREQLETEKSRTFARKAHIPLVENVLKVYYLTDIPAERNALLKSVIEYATYRKEKSERWGNGGTGSSFDLKIFPRTPSL
ncbi:recombinase [Paenibacillus sp. FSL R7-269]|uniref:recombinase family protein n=1 Tax=Paenibacillus sp. FSL R7-269 TaxID=1226755 RepID=UPI0003E1F280|nr:recombinase family protein [Paenibacillus sp. FSL R7-269]ETT45257.1 recombinase [Paenibacillus sp. FSL R7-269]